MENFFYDTLIFITFLITFFSTFFMIMENEKKPFYFREEETFLNLRSHRGQEKSQVFGGRHRTIYH
jgi:hypothetical protein